MDTHQPHPDSAERARLERLQFETRRLIEDSRKAVAAHAAARARMTLAITSARARLEAAAGHEAPDGEAPDGEVPDGEVPDGEPPPMS